MGCQNSNSKIPTLLCSFQTDKQEQYSYCLKLRDNFKHEKTINYQIKSGMNLPFKVQFSVRGKIYDIQTVFDDSENTMNQTLQQMYSLLK